MNEQLDFGWDELVDKEKETKAKKAVKKTQKKKRQAKPMTPEEIEAKWKEILGNPKNSRLDQKRLEETYYAWKQGKIYPQTPKLSKAEGLRMYARLAEMQRGEKLKKMVEETPDNYHLIQTEEQLDWVCELWEEEQEAVGLDTETDGLDIVYGNNRMVGMSVSFPTKDIHVYIPTRHDEGKQLDNDLVIQRLKPYLSNKHKLKVLHNARFDAHVFSMEGVRLRGIKMDTMIAMWCLNENEMSYKLKDLANKYAKFLGVKAENDTFDELFGKDTPFNQVGLKYALVYAAKDTALTVKFANFIDKMFNRKDLKRVRKLYYELENPLLDVCVDMEEAGFLLNTDKVYSIRDELYEDVEKLKVDLIKEFGDINFNSPQQLQEVLYDVKKFPDVSGKRSTDKPTLKKLAEEFDSVQLLLDYRKATKLLSSFIDKLPVLVKSTGRVYGQFVQNATATGRFASKEPNLQQLPPKARTIFKAPIGYVIIGSDFSQIEPRVLAHITGDEDLRKPYKEGYDLYSTLAARTFKLPIEECGDGSKWRKMMKTGLLAVMYGTSMFTLSKQLEISVEEAEQFIEDFYEAYPKVGEWIKSIHEYVKEHEYVETLYGRKRRFPNHKKDAEIYDNLASEICGILGTNKVPHNIWDDKYKKVLPYPLKRKFQSVKGRVERVRRQGVNAIIQGSAADIMKRAMLNLAALAEKYKKDDWKVLATVHDEALLEVPDTITKEQTEEIEAAMTKAASLEVPLKVDVAFMREWGNETKKDDWFAAA
ncbi:DNA polymerase [Terrihalobacillus insolitus]|uniref:DNA polymerase n=1 Tax=Terrihalobacillus insolitus TaxID=2950438 RepID=UPI002341FF3F|nr:DNA polymerase [Terrihalobacillus insolitus]MDC3413939.1 DNA polymerase [Terrihalobacillus insolitus]